VRLITEPEDGIQPVIRAIKNATACVDIAIFRCDIKALERELAAAVARGVVVNALVAHTNRGGDERLRELEQQLLAAGVTVSRTDDDLVRYHGKLLLIDRAALYVLGFNFTSNDLKSRSFGVRTKNPKTIRDVFGLFEADRRRVEFQPSAPDLVISPQNARPRLMRFLRKARVSLDIYDPCVSDDETIQVMKELAAKGVTIRILGNLEKKWQGDDFDARPFPGRRLHVRAIVRDGRRAFVGSQSLRKLELDERREVGLIVREAKIVKEIQGVFERDWKKTKRVERSGTR
jgi:phosphatidylserine/phosphatidylglycerophosphate/cardiolipin synthase-like enzyme